MRSAEGRAAVTGQETPTCMYGCIIYRVFERLRATHTQGTASSGSTRQCALTSHAPGGVDVP